MSVFAGIDGGATHTTVLLTDAAGRPLSRIAGHAALIRETSAEIVAESLAALVRSAQAQVNGQPIEVLCAALTGVGRTAERDEVTRALEKTRIARRAVVVTDAEAALHDAFEGRPGIILIAGTGSVAWGRSATGQLLRAGGWGPVLGDAGSAFAIGIAALRAVALAEDAMAPPTALRGALLEATHQPDAHGLIRWADTASRAAIADLARHVIALASQDTAAATILERATADLATLAVALGRKLAPWPEGVAPVALAGGLLAPGRPLRERVRRAIERATPAMRVTDTHVDAARGAAALARASQT